MSIKMCCPNCHQYMGGPISVERVNGTIGDEEVHSYDKYYECMTCPEIFGVVISVPFLEEES